MVVLDGNLPADTIRQICITAHHSKVPIWFEPTSIPKSTKILQANALDLVTYITYHKKDEKKQ
jgi:hypothetical protein